VPILNDAYCIEFPLLRAHVNLEGQLVYCHRQAFTTAEQSGAVKCDHAFGFFCRFTVFQLLAAIIVPQNQLKQNPQEHEYFSVSDSLHF
jgi:hypothetical protein